MEATRFLSGGFTLLCMPDQKKIEHWKAQYKKIYAVTIGTEKYIYRTLLIGECTQIKKLLEKEKYSKIEGFALLRGVLSPENFDPNTLSPAEGSQLAKHILDSTKIFNPDEFVEFIQSLHKEFVTESRDDFYIWKTNIMSILPGYTLEVLDKLNVYEFFKLILLCEKLSGKKMIDTRAQSTRAQTSIEGHIQTDKMLSKRELEILGAEESTKALREHWNKIKGV